MVVAYAAAAAAAVVANYFDHDNYFADLVDSFAKEVEEVEGVCCIDLRPGHEE